MARGPEQEIHSRTLYGRRKGKKLRPAQAALLETLLPKLAIELPPPGAMLDPQTLFPGKRAVWLEIGFGAGEHLVAQAAANPEIGLIGCEPYVNGQAKALAQIERAGLGNIRLLAGDARLLLAGLKAQSLSRVFILFPDPWPKLRHHKRRLVSRETLSVLSRLMTKGSELRLATDDPSYQPWMVEQACLHPDFDWLAERPGDWLARPGDWPPTRYEQKAISNGRRPIFLRLRRR